MFTETMNFDVPLTTVVKIAMPFSHTKHTLFLCNVNHLHTFMWVDDHNSIQLIFGQCLVV